jgi:hypothetical protein
MRRRERTTSPELYLLEGRALRSALAAHLPVASDAAPVHDGRGSASPAASEARAEDDGDHPGHTAAQHARVLATEGGGAGAGAAIAPTTTADPGIHGGHSTPTGGAFTAVLVAVPGSGDHSRMPGMASDAVTSAMSDGDMPPDAMGRAMPASAAMPSMAMAMPRPSASGPFGQAETPGAIADAPMGMGADATSGMAVDNEVLVAGLDLRPDVEPRIDVETSPEAPPHEMARGMPRDVRAIAMREKARGPRVAIDDSDEPVPVFPRRAPPPADAPPAEPPFDAWMSEYEDTDLAGSPHATTVLVGITAALAWREYEKVSRRRSRADKRVEHLGGVRVDPPGECPPLPFFSEFTSPAAADTVRSSQAREDLCQASGRLM